MALCINAGLPALAQGSITILSEPYPCLYKCASHYCNTRTHRLFMRQVAALIRGKKAIAGGTKAILKKDIILMQVLGTPLLPRGAVLLCAVQAIREKSLQK